MTADDERDTRTPRERDRDVMIAAGICVGTEDGTCPCLRCGEWRARKGHA